MDCEEASLYALPIADYYMYSFLRDEKVADRTQQSSAMRLAVERTQQAKASHFAGRVSLMAGRAGRLCMRPVCEMK